MAKRKSRRSSRGAPETAKRKQWYTIRAPRLFDGRPLGETLADEPEKLPGRVTEVTLQDLTGDFDKSHVKLEFRIAGVRGTEVHTKFVGHELTSDYMRRLTRRQQSKVDDAYDVTTQDGYVIRVKPVAITERRCQTTQKQAIRKIAREVTEEAASGMRMSEFVGGIVGGELASEIYQQARSIYPIKRVEIRRSDVVATPESVDLDADVFPEKTLEEEEEERKAREEAEAAEEERKAKEEAEADAEEAEEEAPEEPEAEDAEPPEEAEEPEEPEAETEEELEEPVEADAAPDEGEVDEPAEGEAGNPADAEDAEEAPDEEEPAEATTAAE